MKVIERTIENYKGNHVENPNYFLALACRNASNANQMQRLNELFASALKRPMALAQKRPRQIVHSLIPPPEKRECPGAPRKRKPAGGSVFEY